MGLEGQLGVLEHSRTLESASHFLVLLSHSASALPSNGSDFIAIIPGVVIEILWECPILINTSKECFFHSSSISAPSSSSSSSSSSSPVSDHISWFCSKC